MLDMQATLWENLQVDMLSRMFLSSADIVAIMAVRQLPPGWGGKKEGGGRETGGRWREGEGGGEGRERGEVEGGKEVEIIV